MIGRPKSRIKNQESRIKNQESRIEYQGWAVDGFNGLSARLSGAGPNDGHDTTRVWLTPDFDQSHTPPGKIRSSRCRSVGESATP
jgi:hypothetical protein